MGIEQWWSASLGVLALVSTGLAGARRRSAWVIGMVAQVGWTGFAWFTDNYGFLVPVAGFSVIYVRNYIAWKRLDEAPAIRSRPDCACPCSCAPTARPRRDTPPPSPSDAAPPPAKFTHGVSRSAHRPKEPP